MLLPQLDLTLKIAMPMRNGLNPHQQPAYLLMPVSISDKTARRVNISAWLLRLVLGWITPKKLRSRSTAEITIVCY